jgi:hypothetical protein
MKHIIDNFEDNLSNIFQKNFHQNKNSACRRKGQTTKEIINNINNFDESCNNPETARRMESGFKYLRNLVNSIKSPIKRYNSSASVDSILESLSSRDSFECKTKVLNSRSNY